MSKLNRKKFLKTGGLSLAALAFAPTIGGCGKDTPAADPADEKEIDVPEYPFEGLVKIDDLDYVKQRAWDGYKEGG
ncbi:hypothetical protein [Natranaerofaba carboxydovora]|uniref:hypothetical protein n=1 Tax=Natranaerofaba carboxydovora TaxID=2742683 RepID=UPI001F143BB0|nr:hypothetical protein [Natranaerofaba carboxydovora]UMZ75071.1 hypothetical protein ACONDI_02683 [Natranaerofaba carboxydovora]